MDDQLKQQYMAYMFTIPVLFCIILFMLLYMFYLTKPTSASSPPPPGPPPTISRTSSFVISLREVGLKEDLIDKLPTVVFDEELKARELLCCVCLGEFEMKEELIQVPSCNHIFHRDCIRNWLSFTTTCPLCRCSIVVVDDTKLVLPPETSPAALLPDTSIQLTASGL